MGPWAKTLLMVNTLDVNNFQVAGAAKEHPQQCSLEKKRFGIRVNTFAIRAQSDSEGIGSQLILVVVR